MNNRSIPVPDAHQGRISQFPCRERSQPQMPQTRSLIAQPKVWPARWRWAISALLFAAVLSPAWACSGPSPHDLVARAAWDEFTRGSHRFQAVVLGEVVLALPPISYFPAKTV